MQHMRAILVRQSTLVAVIAVALVAAVAVAANGVVFPLDDAYITLHNARVLLSGQDENYGVSPLIGATSPIHLALTAAALPAIPQPALAALAVNSLGAMVYLLGVVALADQRGLGLWRKAAVLIIAAGSGYSAYHLFNGLETSWAMAGVAWALALAGRPRLGPALPVLCGLLPFLRPELAALSGLLLAHQGWCRWKSGSSRWPAAFALDLALSAAAAAPWMVWMLAETGALSPATGAAKRAFFAESGLSTPRKLVGASLAMAFGLGAPLLTLAMAPRRALTLVCWGFALAFFIAFAATMPDGLTHNHHRYVYVLLPACVWALCQIGDARLLTITLVICLAGAVFSTTRAVAAYGDGQEITRQHLGLARWAQVNLPADARILVHDAGVPAYATNLRLIDLVGLKTPPSMQAHLRLTEPSRGDQRGDAIDAIARDASHSHAILLSDTPLFWGKIASDLRGHGWTLSPIGPATPNYRLYALDRPSPATVESDPLRLRPAG